MVEICVVLSKPRVLGPLIFWISVPISIPWGHRCGCAALISRSIETLVHYPDPDAYDLIQAASKHFGVSQQEILVGNGSTELLFALTQEINLKQVLIPVPAYIDYANAAQIAQKSIRYIPLPEQGDFVLDPDELAETIDPGTLVMVGQPNNPTGTMMSADKLRQIALDHPHSHFLVDEAFSDFVPDYQSLKIDRPDNVSVLYSMTKFYAVPGLRLGLAFANEQLACKVRHRLLCWSVNSLAQAFGVRALADADYFHQSQRNVADLRQQLAAGLCALPGIKVYPSETNFLLVRLEDPSLTAPALREKLLRDGLAIRVCDNFMGLDQRYFRLAVRTHEDNQCLLDRLERVLAGQKPLGYKPDKPKRAKSLMFQGTGSNAGKSILTAALCRILRQDGVSVAPFKAQNMSLNSFVTVDGGEMGRAQVLQAQACRLEPDVRMNPILLKPNSDTGSQVILLGKPYANLDVMGYIEIKRQALAQVHQAYDSLASEYEAIVIEGAGSPGEVNLKQHDIVNMKMARYANAPVILIGDIDRGGVFASFVGHLEVMEEWERRLVVGFLINKFRGDASLLHDATEYVKQFTGKPTLGVIDYVADLGLPDEDSVSFKDNSEFHHQQPNPSVEIAVISLPHISNQTDIDPFRIEPDVSLQVVSRPEQLHQPDVIVLPGSKNVIHDLAWLHQSGLADRIKQLVSSNTRLVGICGGYQMLGQVIRDPLSIESDTGGHVGLGFLDLETHMAEAKILRRTRARHLPTGCDVIGYEIHHGVTHQSDPLPFLVSADKTIVGVQNDSGRIWGTYLHGVFDSDLFRRHFLDLLRCDHGLEPLGSVQAVYDLEPALDRLADQVRDSVSVEQLYSLMGL